MISHPLFLLAPRSSDHAEPCERSGCLYPSLNGVRSGNPRERFEEGRSKVSAETLAEVEAALAIVLGLEVLPASGGP